MSKNKLLSVPFILFTLFCHSQNNDIHEAQINIEAFQKKYPDEETIIINSSKIFTFNIDNQNKTVVITEKDIDKYLALKHKITIVAHKYYNAYSEITKHKVIGSNLFNTKHYQTCGNFEIDNVFYDDAKVCKFYLKFDKPGEQLSLNITKKYLDPKYFTTVFFNEPYAIDKRKIKFIIPHNIDMEIIEFNLDEFEIEKLVYEDNKSKSRIIEYTIEHFPSIYRIKYLPGPSYIFPHLVIVIKGYSYTNEYFHLINDMNDINLWNISLIGYSKPSSELSQLTMELIKEQTSDSAKIASINYWIQDNIRYIAFEDGLAAFKPDYPDNVLAKKYGDCKGMANLAKTMLRQSGFDARICWIGTDHICYSHDLSSLVVDNHMICAVKMNDGFLFLDPTVKYSTINEIPDHIQGREVLIENSPEYLIKTIPSTDFNNNLLLLNNQVRLNKDNLNVKGRITLKGEQKRNFQYFMNEIAGSDKQKVLNFFITKIDNNFSITEISNTPIDTITDKIEINYKLDISNIVIDLDNEILFSLDFYNEFYKSKIDTARCFDFLFDRRLHIIHNSTLLIPKEYEIKHLPENINIEHPKFAFNVSYYLKDDSLLIYNKQLSIKERLLKKEYFESWNNSIDKLDSFYKDMIILKKK